MTDHQTDAWLDAFDSCSYYHLHRYFSCNDKLLTHVKRHGNRVLEIGLGTGLGAVSLMEEGREVIGLDVSSTVLNHVKSKQDKYDAHFDLVRGDIRNLPFRNFCFDVSYSGGLLEHLEFWDLLKSMREMVRVSGKAVIEIPSDKWLEHPASTFHYGDEHFIGWHHWDALIELSGLKIIERYGWGLLPKHQWIKNILPPIIFKHLEQSLSTNLGYVISY